MASVGIELTNIVNELRASKAVDAAAVIRRDGILMASNFPKNPLGNEVFAMMSATILGAAKNITLKSSMGLPSKVTIETKEGNFVISNAGTKAILICLIRNSIDPTFLKEAMEAAGEKIKAIL